MRGARIGTEFAGYRIEALLGRGGTSTVYRAENPKLGIRVALKILNAELAEDEGFRERFVRESRVAAGINHPNVITIYDAGVWEESLYIAMRYVAGGDLRARLREGALEVDRALSILTQVGSALDAAHARGLIHRDVKPANVMIDAGAAEDAPEVAYVTDFGLIKDVHSGGRPTPTGEFLGTIAYVAPEQIEGRPVDARADVYSLGCVAFECLTGQAPFRRENDAAVLWAHMKESPPAISAVRPDLPQHVDRVVAGAMAKDPGRRFETCSSFASALREVLAGGTSDRPSLTIPIARVTAPERGGRFSRVLGAGLVAVAVGASGVGAGLLLADEGERTLVRTVIRTSTATTTVRAEPTSRLVSLVPEALRRRCRSAPPPTPEFDESLVCRVGGAVEVVRYSHAFSGPLLSEYFIRRAVQTGRVARPGEGERLQAAGSCVGRDLPAIEEWVVAGRAGHEPVFRTELGDSDGRVVCQVNGRRASIEWTASRFGIYAIASGPSYVPLLRWWQTEAGPLY